MAVTDGVANAASVVALERPSPADTLDPGRTPSLGDAMAEAYRSPFHAAASAPGIVAGGDEVGVTEVRSPFSGGLTPYATDGSTPFSNVFFPTLATAFLFDIGGFFLVVGCALAFCNTEGQAFTMLLLGASAAVLGPAAVARSLGKETWTDSILGSTIGLGLGIAIGLGTDYEVAVLTVPITHALVTTVFGRL